MPVRKWREGRKEGEKGGQGLKKEVGEGRKEGRRGRGRSREALQRHATTVGEGGLVLYCTVLVLAMDDERTPYHSIAREGRRRRGNGENKSSLPLPSSCLHSSSPFWIRYNFGDRWSVLLRWEYTEEMG